MMRKPRPDVASGAAPGVSGGGSGHAAQPRPQSVTASAMPTRGFTVRRTRSGPGCPAG